MIIDCTADLHGHYPKLEGGDLLIVAGDLTASDTQAQYLIFREWLRAQEYKQKIFICGNHDRCIEQGLFYFNEDWMGAKWLNDSGTEFEGFKIWGSPWTKRFKGMNPSCMAFTVETDEELAEKWKLIPDDIDILVTHCPPWGILDKVDTIIEGHYCDESTGSKSLIERVNEIKPSLHVFGHIHECGGNQDDLVFYENFSGIKMCVMVNASHVNERYKPVNKPIRIEL